MNFCFKYCCMLNAGIHCESIFSIFYPLSAKWIKINEWQTIWYYKYVKYHMRLRFAIIMCIYLIVCYCHLSWFDMKYNDQKAFGNLESFFFPYVCAFLDLLLVLICNNNDELSFNCANFYIETIQWSPINYLSMLHKIGKTTIKKLPIHPFAIQISNLNFWANNN